MCVCVIACHLCVFFIGLSDFVLLLICWSSTFISEWTILASYFQLLADGRISRFSEIPWWSELNRVIFEWWCNFLRLIGHRVVLLYPVISVLNKTCYLDKNIGLTILLYLEDVCLVFFPVLHQRANSFSVWRTSPVLRFVITCYLPG